MSVHVLARGRFSRWERLAAWLILMLLGGLQAFTFADRLDPDGIAYLDIAAAYARGDWAAAVNPYWSPAISWLLAALQKPLDLAGCGGLARVHVVMVGLYAFALWSFERLVRALSVTGSGPDAMCRGWRWFTYGMFGIVTLQLIGLVWLTPDLLLLAILCLSASLGLRTLAPGATRRTAAGFGALLGVAYWAKAAAFPLAFLFIGTAWALSRAARRRLTWSAGAFVLTAALWLVPLSLHQGRPTFGDAGRLNAAWFLGSVEPAYHHWQGGDATGTPAHPMARPDGIEAFAFPASFPRATYPPWYAPAHWHEGIQPRFGPAAALRNVREGAGTVLGSTPVPFAAASVAVLWLLARPRRRDLRPASLLLLVPGTVGLCAYLVLHVELRLVAPMILLIWLGLVAMPRPRSGSTVGRLASIGLVLAGLMAAAPLLDATRQIGFLRAGVTPGRDQDCAIAAAIAAADFPRGSRLAVVGDASAAAWAWVGGFRIVGDMPDPDRYWSLTPAEREDLHDFFEHAGARAVVAPAPAGAEPSPSEWEPLGETRHLVRPLATSAVSGARDPAGQPGPEDEGQPQ